MHQRSVAVVAFAICTAFICDRAHAQSTTYHLHKEASNIVGLFQLKEAPPDAGAVTIASIDLKKQPLNEYLVKAFDTQPGVPSAAGTIAAGSSVSVSVWMNKSANAAAMYPRVKVNLNSAAGPALCTATGANALTTTVASYTLTCTTSSVMSMTPADRFYMWVGVSVTTAANKSVKAQLAIEGVPNGAYDSRVVVPMPRFAPEITRLSPTSGPVASLVTITGSNFGSTATGGRVTFNRAAATATAWGATSITAPVPAGATTGPVVVMVGDAASNGVPFTVISDGALRGLVSRASDGSPMSGAAVEVMRGRAVVAATTTNITGQFSFDRLASGSYDVRVSATDMVVATHNGIGIVAGQTTTEDFVLARAYGVVTYAYDDLNRLIGVVDQDGAGAAYRYDAVGNVVSIDRQRANTVAILGFSPTSGPPGATVRINGTAFGPLPGNDTVRFNGSTAAITTATTTQIVATVPIGATSGPLTVETPAGSAVSTVSFIVSNDQGAPTVSDFNPQIAAPGMSIIISGSNFDLLPANNVVRQNVALMPPTSVSTNSIGATVGPSATSGHVSVRTPRGSGASAGVLFVPPPPYGVSDVATARAAAVGEPQSFVRQAGKIDLLAFDGAAHQRISVVASDGTPLSLFDPYGALMMSAWDFLGPVILPFDATYTVLHDRCDSFFCPSSYTTTVIEVPPDVVGTIAIDGPPVTFTLGTRGQQAHLTFAGAAGQHVGIVVPQGTIECCFWVSLIAPSGAAVTGQAGLSFKVGDFSDLVLPESGTYILLSIVPNAGATGTLTFELDSITDVSGSIVIDGPPIAVITSARGQNATITFDGTAGTHVGIDLTDATFSRALVSVENPDGTPLVAAFFISPGGEVFKDATLPQTGTYTIVVDPSGSYTGRVAVAVTTIPPDVTAALTIGGPSVAVTIPVRGQRAVLALDGTAGQRFAIKIISSAIDFFEIGVAAPDGTSTRLGWGSRNQLITAAYDVRQSGAHAITLAPIWSPGASTTGTVTLSALAVAPDIVGTLAIGDSPVPVTFTTIRQRAIFSFPGSAGQHITAWARNDTTQFIELFVTILDPAGGFLAGSSGGAQAGESFGRPIVLPATGTYTVMFDIGSFPTGTISVSVTTP